MNWPMSPLKGSNYFCDSSSNKAAFSAFNHTHVSDEQGSTGPQSPGRSRLSLCLSRRSLLLMHLHSEPWTFLYGHPAGDHAQGFRYMPVSSVLRCTSEMLNTKLGL